MPFRGELKKKKQLRPQSSPPTSETSAVSKSGVGSHRRSCTVPIACPARSDLVGSNLAARRWPFWTPIRRVSTGSRQMGRGGGEQDPVLTRREREVLVELCRPRGRGAAFTEPAATREIAAALFVTEAAVKQHLLRLYDKFGFAGRREPARGVGERGRRARLVRGARRLPRRARSPRPPCRRWSSSRRRFAPATSRSLGANGGRHSTCWRRPSSAAS